MKNSIVIKFIAVFLCASTLFIVCAGGLSFLLMGTAGVLGDKSIAELKQETTEQHHEFLARELLSNWASNSLGDVPEEITDAMSEESIGFYYRPDGLHYTVTDRSGREVFSNYSGEEGTAYPYSFPAVSYHKLWEPSTAEAPAEEYTPTESMDEVLTEETAAPEEAVTDEFAAATQAEVPAPAAIRPENVITHWFYDEHSGMEYRYNYTCETASGYSITLYVTPGASVKEDPIWNLLEQTASRKRALITACAASAVLLAISVVYLCCSAGRKPGSDTVKAGGLNALPLDLYAAIVLTYGGICVLTADQLGHRILDQGIGMALGCASVAGFLGCLIVVGFCFAFVAQIKTGGGYWWLNSLCGKCILLCWKLCCGIFRLIPKCWIIAKKIWNAGITVLAWLVNLTKEIFRRTIGWSLGKLERFFAMLPLTWQWLVSGMLMIVTLLICMAAGLPSALFGIGLCIALVLYGAGSFGTLYDAVRKMRSGDLETKTDDRYLVGCFKDFSVELNGLADVAMVAAQKQLKSDRMKTELITNVSHDIKTPLTSIINYVDLLAKPHTDEEEKAYLEVLSRQSARMKKLIEDLIEMSKATTGNIPVEISQVDAAEAVNQALGEFADKLDAAGLIPVFRQPQEDTMILADGRLFWRAMSNVLSNAVKYALPGTRLYVDISRAQDKVMISLKNISRAELNVTADELLERFVRGDTSRNTEGSGLGLNIAQSLMELQKGQLQLLVDGDLFKVTLIFPKA